VSVCLVLHSWLWNTWQLLYGKAHSAPAALRQGLAGPPSNEHWNVAPGGSEPSTWKRILPPSMLRDWQHSPLAHPFVPVPQMWS